MGTRNLTMVIQEEKPVIAQYGQWDGYPDGQGTTILSFLSGVDLDKFKKKLGSISFLTQEEAQELDDSGNPFEKRPYLSRDIGGKILHAVYHGEWIIERFGQPVETKKFEVDKLQDETAFAGDGLFCEWAYVVDLDKNTFEVYEGFGKEPLKEDERFYHLQKEGEEYKPVRMVQSFDLDKLPTEDEFLNAFKNEEEE